MMGKRKASPATALLARKPSRDCPADFESVFVGIGRFDCEEHFRARRSTITRWLVECGKERLIKARAAYVAEQRGKGEWMTRSTKLITHREISRPSIRTSIRDRRQVSLTVARHAAHYLRIRRNGGMIVSPAGDGEWWVGTKRLSAAQMVDLARIRGFDDSEVIIFGGEPPLQPDGRDGLKD